MGSGRPWLCCLVRAHGPAGPVRPLCPLQGHPRFAFYCCWMPALTALMLFQLTFTLRIEISLC